MGYTDGISTITPDMKKKTPLSAEPEHTLSTYYIVGRHHHYDRDNRSFALPPPLQSKEPTNHHTACLFLPGEAFKSDLETNKQLNKPTQINPYHIKTYSSTSRCRSPCSRTPKHSPLRPPRSPRSGRAWPRYPSRCRGCTPECTARPPSCTTL